MNMSNKSLNQKLIKIQSRLNCPKNLYNSFGKYYYRNTESILEALKPLLSEYNISLIITDDIVLIGERYYVKATVKLIDAESGEVIETSALAREEETKKGADGSQITGASSSYARKYALNGMFAIDDTKDSDTTNTHGKEDTAKNELSEAQIKRLYALGKNANVTNEQILAVIKTTYNKTDAKMLTKEEYDNLCKRLEKKANG